MTLSRSSCCRFLTRAEPGTSWRTDPSLRTATRAIVVGRRSLRGDAKRTVLPAPEAHSQSPEPTLKRRNRLMVEADFAVDLVTGAAHLQKSLKRSGAISVYLTVCWMFLWPR